MQVRLFRTLVLCFVTSLLTHTAGLAVEHPNIVLIFTDDQGWGTTSIMQDPDVPESKSDFFQTPNLERLAEMGVRFTDAYASHCKCGPSRAALLTGISPAKLQATDNFSRHSGPNYEGHRLLPAKHVTGLARDYVTLPEIIKKNLPEYKTAHFGKWHVGKTRDPETRGFDTSDGGNGNRAGSDDANLPDDPKRAFSLTRKGNEWMEEQVKAGNPFYLQISHYAVHIKYQSKPETTEKFKQATPGQRHQTVKFAAMIFDMDTAIGLMLDKIRELGIQDNTYIICTSDNGTYSTDDASNINGPLSGCKATVWEGGIRVPFIVAGPGIASNSLCRRMVVGYDIFPTVCDLLGIQELPSEVEGGSFNHLLRAPDGPPVKRPHDFLVFHWPHYEGRQQSIPDTTLRKGNMKLHYFYETNEIKLFDLSKDLAEQNDLSSAMPEKATELRKAMTAYLSAIDANMPVENPEFNPDQDPASRRKKKGKRKK